MSHTTTPTTVTKRTRLGGRIAAALLTAAALTMTNAPLSSAAEMPSSWDRTYTGWGVTVYVEKHGDIIYVCDTLRNGHSAWVEVRDESIRFYYYTLTARGGKGTCALHSAKEGKPYDLWENTEIHLEYGGKGPDSFHSATFLNNH